LELITGSKTTQTPEVAHPKTMNPWLNLSTQAYSRSQDSQFQKPNPTAPGLVTQQSVPVMFQRLWQRVGMRDTGYTSLPGSPSQTRPSFSLSPSSPTSHFTPPPHPIHTVALPPWLNLKLRPLDHQQTRKSEVCSVRTHGWVTVSPDPNRCYEESARKLFITAMLPLTSLSFMLLRWQRAELDNAALSDSDSDDGTGGLALYTTNDNNGEPSVRYTTHEEYKQ